MIIDTNKYVTRKTAAEILGVTIQAIGYHIKKGNPPPSIEVCGKLFFLKEALQEWKTKVMTTRMHRIGD